MKNSKKKCEMLPMCSAKGYFAGKKDERCYSCFGVRMFMSVCRTVRISITRFCTR